jgi:hypothetical protein
VKAEVSPVLIDGGPFQVIGLGVLDPVLAGFGHGDAGGVRRVPALADLHRDRRVVGVRRLLLLEGFDVALAVLVHVIDHPRLLRFAPRVLPRSLSYRHVISLFEAAALSAGG